MSEDSDLNLFLVSSIPKWNTDILNSCHVSKYRYLKRVVLYPNSYEAMYKIKLSKDIKVLLYQFEFKQG